MLRILTKPVDAVIQGGSDMGARLSEDELQQTFDFCLKVFAPVPDQHRATKKLPAEGLKGQATDNPDPEGANQKLVDVHAPAVREQAGSTPSIQPNAGCGELDMKVVFDEVSARKAVLSEHGGVHNFETEPLGQSGTGGGWVARLEKGKLGLVPGRC
jgi:hypothetical protein